MIDHDRRRRRRGVFLWAFETDTLPDCCLSYALLDPSFLLDVFIRSFLFTPCLERRSPYHCSSLIIYLARSLGFFRASILFYIVLKCKDGECTLDVDCA